MRMNNNVRGRAFFRGLLNYQKDLELFDGCGVIKNIDNQ
jgi:hypothetical protein